MKQVNSNCDEAGGKLMPIVNFNSCGGKEDCVSVCPYDVFEMQPISKEDKTKLNLKENSKPFSLRKSLRYQSRPMPCLRTLCTGLSRKSNNTDKVLKS